MSQPAKLRVWEKTLFGAGALGNGVVNTAIASLLLLFYNQGVGLDPEWVGAALMISIILDAIWDPMIGHWSDNARTRWGRRHPFMYASVLPAAVAFYLLFAPPLTWSDQALFVYLLVTVMAVRFFISVYEITSSALVPEIAPDYDDRTNVWSFRFFFGIAGAFLMVSLAYQVFLPAGGGLTAPAGYATFGLASAAIIVVTLGVSTLSVHNWIPRLRQPAVEKWSPKEVWGDLASVLRNRTFVVLMLSGLISGLAKGLSDSLSLYFNSYYWELGVEHISLIVMVGLGSSLVGVALAPYASRKLGKKRAMLWVFWLSLFVSVLPVTFRLLGMLPPNGDPIVFWILMIDRGLAGILGLMGIVIVVSLLTDVVEENAATTGRRTEGLLFAFNGVLQKSISGVGTFAAGMLLAFVAFPAQAVPGMVDETILRNMALIYVPVTAGLSALAIAMLSFLKVGRERHEENLRRLEIDPVPVNIAAGLPSATGVQIVPEARELRL